MKKLFVLLIAILPLTAMADNDRPDRPVSFEQLPAAAQKFIREHFPKLEISLATVDREILDTTYDVIFVNAVHIEFDSRGQWEEIDCTGTILPESVLLPEITSFIKEKYPNTNVRGVERDKHGYEVNLYNRAELYFDLKGRFRGYDD